MKKALLYLIVLGYIFSSTSVYAVKEYANRFPTSTALEVFTPNNKPSAGQVTVDTSSFGNLIPITADTVQATLDFTDNLDGAFTITTTGTLGAGATTLSGNLAMGGNSITGALNVTATGDITGAQILGNPLIMNAGGDSGAITHLRFTVVKEYVFRNTLLNTGDFIFEVDGAGNEILRMNAGTNNIDVANSLVVNDANTVGEGLLLEGSGSAGSSKGGQIEWWNDAAGGSKKYMFLSQGNKITFNDTKQVGPGDVGKANIDCSTGAAVFADGAFDIDSSGNATTTGDISLIGTLNLSSTQFIKATNVNVIDIGTTDATDNMRLRLVNNDGAIVALGKDQGAGVFDLAPGGNLGFDFYRNSADGINAIMRIHGEPTGTTQASMEFQITNPSGTDTRADITTDATLGFSFGDDNLTTTGLGQFGAINIDNTDFLGLDVELTGAKSGADAYGGYIRNLATQANSTGQKYGLRLTSTGTWSRVPPIVNNYLLYLDDPTGGSTNYAIFQTGTTGTNVLNAATRIGSTDKPTTGIKLDLTGDQLISGTLKVRGTASNYSLTPDLLLGTNSDQTTIDIGIEQFTSYSGANRLIYSSIFEANYAGSHTDPIVTAIFGGASLDANPSGGSTIYGLFYGITQPSTTITQGTHNWYAQRLKIYDSVSNNPSGGTFNTYTLYLEDEPTGFGSATLNHWAIFSEGGDFELTDGNLTTIGDISTGGLNFTSASELTISSGAVTVTQGHHKINTEGNAANDDLDTINGGDAGEILLILPANSTRTVRIRNGIGNIFLKHQVDSHHLSFSSPSGAGAAIRYAGGGYYDWSDTAVTLNQGSLTQTYGSANTSYAAHASIVARINGTVDTGTVSIVVSGTSIDDEGNRSTGDSETILADITAAGENGYHETVKKWLGTITYTLTETAGSPTTYSIDFNYGFSKYEDFGNQSFTVTGLQVVGVAGANDTNFNMILFHHNSAGWAYLTPNFVPGGTQLANMNTDHSTEQNLANGKPFSWKRTDLNTDIAGDDSEGIIFRIDTSSAKAVESMSGVIWVHTAPAFSYMSDTKQHLIFMEHGGNWLEL